MDLTCGCGALVASHRDGAAGADIRSWDIMAASGDVRVGGAA